MRPLAGGDAGMLQQGAEPEVSRKRLVLVGTGHAHLGVLRRLPSFVAAGHEVVVVAPGDFWHAGLTAAALGGRHAPTLGHIDVAGLVSSAGGRFVRANVAAVDPRHRLLRLDHRASLTYDLLSFDLEGRSAPIPGVEAFGDRSFALAPATRLVDLRRAVESQAARDRTRSLRIVVVGTGAPAVEAAANLLALGRRIGAPLSVTLLGGAGPPLPDLPAPAAERVVEILRTRGLDLRTGASGVTAVPGAVLADDGTRVACDVVVNASRPVSDLPGLDSGLALDAAGALRIDATLRSITDPIVFGAGSFAAVEGVSASRGTADFGQSRILARNLAAVLQGGPLASWRPRARAITTLNLGDGTGVVARGELWWHGRLPLLVKDQLDLRFVARHGRPPGE